MKCLEPPWSKKVTCKKVTWGRTPLGLETVPADRPRAALAVEEAERRWNL
jgi:hypothetical protein